MFLSSQSQPDEQFQEAVSKRNPTDDLPEGSPQRVFALTLAYDGTSYSGWQFQINAITVQQRVEEAVEQVLGVRTAVFGSGRTDSGVHAIGQVVRLATSAWKHAAGKLVPALNRRLPRDIVVRSAREARTDFDPVRSAKSKRYRYTIRAAHCDCPMTRHLHWYFPRPLNVESMQQAGQYLLGCHDFKAFQTLGSPRLTTVRTIRDLSIVTQPNRDGSDILIEIEADGFLYNMVRNIVGALIEVGRDRYAPHWMVEVLESKKRRGAGMTAPSHGLLMLHVEYPESLWIDNEPCE